MNEYWKYRVAGFSDAEVKADMLARAKAAGFTDQEANADIFQQSISPDQQAYDLLNRPNPALLNYFGQAFAKAQAMPAPLPKAPANAQPMPDDAAIVDPAKHPGDYHDVTAASDPSIMQAAQQGFQGSVTGLLLRGKLPDALTNDQVADLTMPQRLAMQVGQIGGDLPAMFLGALSGAFAQPEAAPLTAAAGTFAMPAALRQILVDEYQKGEIQTPKEFIQRAAMALWAATKAGTVGAVTHGAGVAARGIAPVLQVPAEVAAMTTAGAAVEGQLPSAQDFVDGAMLVGALHGVGRLGGKAVRAAQDVTPKLRDLYARTGLKPDQVVQDAQADPSIAEDLLGTNSPNVPRSYEDQAGIRRFSDGDVVGRITAPAAQEINRLGFDTAASDVKITEKTIQHIEEMHGGQLTGQDVNLISQTIEDPNEVLPNLGEGITEYQKGSVLFVRDEGKSYVAVVEIIPGEDENTLLNYWKMSPEKAKEYLDKFREEKQRRLESGLATEPPSSSQQDSSVQAGKPEGLSGSQTQAASSAELSPADIQHIDSNDADVNSGEAGTAGRAGRGEKIPQGRSLGRSRPVIAASGNGEERLPAHYELRELDSLTASHDPLAGFAKTPGYPEGVQDRPYHTSAAHREQVLSRAARFDPDYVVNTSATAEGGPSIVTRDGTVLGGNGRVMILRVLAEKNPERYADYVQALRDEAKSFGLQPEDVDHFRRPVLVRALDFDAKDKTTHELGRISGLLNKSSMTGRDRVSVGVAAAKSFSRDTLATFAADSGKYDSLRDYLSSPAAMEKLVPALERDGVLDAQNRDSYLIDGRLTPEGKNAVEDSLRGYVIPDNDLLQHLRRTGTDEMKVLDFALPHLAYLKAVGANWVSPEMEKATRLFLDYNANRNAWRRQHQGEQRKYEPEFYLRQPSLLPEMEAMRNDRMAREQFRALVHFTPREYAAAWQHVAREMREVLSRPSLPGVPINAASVQRMAENIMHEWDERHTRTQSAPTTGALYAASPGTQIPFVRDGSQLSESSNSKAARISDVVKLLQSKLGAPIRTGRLGNLSKAVSGIYKLHPEVIRTRIANDITTVAHEVGHHLQRVLFGEIDPADLEPWSKELEGIATQPNKGQNPLTEGFAEFVARYIVNPEQAKAEAPKFLEAFEAKLDKDAPEIKQVLLQARETVQKWARQPAVMRVLSHISSGESDKPPLLERAKDAMSYKAWIDRLNPINDMVKAGRKPNEKLMGDENPYTAARVYAGWTGKATEFLEGGPFNFNTLQGHPATSFVEILRAVDKHANLDEFRAYLIAKSALERGNRGMLSKGFLDDAKAVVSELDKKAYDVYADSLYEFKNEVLDYLRDSGVVSAHTVAKMRVAWKYHVPFYRVMDEGRGAAGAGKGLQARNPIKQARGSGRDIIDPLESIVKDTYLFINMAERNRVVESLVHFAETHQGLGKFVEKIPTPMRGTKVQTDEILRALRENSDLNAQEVQALFGDSDLATTIFRPNAFLDKESQIALFRDGKRTIYQVSPDIAKVVNGLDQEGMNTLTRIMSYPTRLLRAGATLTPEFLTRNLTRDSLDAFIFSKYGFIPGVDTMRGLFHVLRRDDLYHDWVKSGGQHSMFVSLDRDSIQKTLEDLRQGGVLDHVRNLIKNPLEAMRILSEYSEEATRLGEYAKARTKLGDSRAAMVESGYASREVTLDFARMGAYGRILNPVIAFWNTHMQGLDKTIRSFKERPMATTMKAIAAYMLPAVMLEIANAVPENQQQQDEVLAKKAAGEELTPAEQSLYMRIQYQQLPAWERDAFLCVPAGGIIWRIPRGFELGTLFGAVSARVTRWALGKINQNSNGHEFDQLLNSIGGGAMPGIVPTAAAPFVENWANKSTFFDRPIVPADREDLLPELQYTPNTTQLTQSLSATIGALPNMRTLTFSPAKAENLVQGWLGGMGDYALRAADWGLRSAGIIPNPTRPDMTLADMPVIRGFVARYPSASADDIQRFWNNWQDSQAYAKSISALGKEFRPDDAMKLLGESDFNSLAGVHEAVTKQNAFIRMVEQNPELDGAKKRELIDSAYVQMLVTARLGNMIYDNAKQAMQQQEAAQ